MLLALRINVLAKGYSGISLETLKQVIEVFNGNAADPPTEPPWRLDRNGWGGIDETRRPQITEMSGKWAWQEGRRARRGWKVGVGQRLLWTLTPFSVTLHLAFGIFKTR